jgi:hypothetical protein
MAAHWRRACGGRPAAASHHASVLRCPGRAQVRAARIPRGRAVAAPRSHHRIAENRPDVVVAAIREVVSG